MRVTYSVPLMIIVLKCLEGKLRFFYFFFLVSEDALV